MDEVAYKILNLLEKSNGPLTTLEIIEKLGISKASASIALYKLLKLGKVRRVFIDGVYDPPYHFDTSSWEVVR